MNFRRRLRRSCEAVHFSNWGDAEHHQAKVRADFLQRKSPVHGQRTGQGRPMIWHFTGQLYYTIPLTRGKSKIWKIHIGMNAREENGRRHWRALISDTSKWQVCAGSMTVDAWSMPAGYPLYCVMAASREQPLERYRSMRRIKQKIFYSKQLSPGHNFGENFPCFFHENVMDFAKL